MTDDRLRNTVLARADADDELSEQARLVILAALGTPGDLAEVLGAKTASADLVEALTAVDDEDVLPVGAFLRSITVQGFRGVGPQVTVPFHPAPGLTVVAGRNGSGKSTLAEGLELALTGRNSRWSGRTAVWSQNWRNLHAGKSAHIRVDFAEQGSGSTQIGVDWPDGNDIAVEQSKVWVQRAGQKREDPSTLGWVGALEMYRPLLSYDELGGILEGRPSDFYDQLHKLLGLEQLTEAMARLEAEVKALKEPSAEARKAKDTLRLTLESCNDPRAAAALAQLRRRKADLLIVRPLVTEGAAVTLPFAWQRAQRLTTVSAEDVKLKCDALRSAADGEDDKAQRTDKLAADRARLLELSLAFRKHHGDQLCPVCGHGQLTRDWAAAVRAVLEQDQLAMQALKAARAETVQARSAVMDVVRDIDAPPLTDVDLTALPAARSAFEAFAKLPADGHRALADHLEAALPALTAAYAALREEASTLIQEREDLWAPVALQLAEWINKVERAEAVDHKLAVANEALKWLQNNATELRNERIAPLAGRAREIWSTLRQESNVDLGAIRLTGQRTTRRVVLEADVDGTGTEALGVMSQGELQALALAIFIPRATARQSPFRFLVLDDPIQAMDPSKIDGFLSVLTSIAESRQVVVFTHDNRLPAAIRRSRAPARIVEVSRGSNSVVTIAESSRPADRLLADAFAIAADDAVPLVVKRAAVPVLCREALEATAWDVFSASALSRGDAPPEIESAWENATTTRTRIGLAVDPSNAEAVGKWLTGGPARAHALKVAAKGGHSDISDFRGAVKATRLATGDLAKLGS